MLEQAEAKRKGVKKEIYGKTVEFIKGSATKLPFAENSFNCASIAFGLRNIADRQAALQELNRVLTPAGKLFVLEFFPPKETLLARLFGWYFHVALPWVAGLFSDAAAYKYLPQSVAQMPKPDAFAKLVNAEGFDILDNRAFIFGHCRLYQLYKRTT